MRHLEKYSLSHSLKSSCPLYLILINFYANIFALDNDLESPLDAAASRGKNECVVLLDKTATTQNIMNTKKVTKLKEQAQENARRQINECKRFQEKHQNKMAWTYSKEESGTLSSSKGTLSRSSLSHASASSTFGSLSKGIKGSFKIKFKKNKDTEEQDEDTVELEEDIIDATALEVFLQSHHLEEFLPFFMREQIDLEVLMLYSDEDLQSIQLQVGPRKKILNAINGKKQMLQQPGQLVDTSL
ncbi:Ankyrin repeat and SAM domain-containing protein 4B [Pteropus alecto]|uniref:Ankyrin repeat and SAM domain-containing protein 4B n=1 Tax=Pteropus alecto TaxID=9402 RepID=L5JVB3_PTEAL|nr:Ankyrin repeat and SAM domain-containing protein 4B [Pteropus alecto]